MSNEDGEKHEQDREKSLESPRVDTPDTPLSGRTRSRWKAAYRAVFKEEPKGREAEERIRAALNLYAPERSIGRRQALEAVRMSQALLLARGDDPLLGRQPAVAVHPGDDPLLGRQPMAVVHRGAALPNDRTGSRTDNLNDRTGGPNDRTAELNDRLNGRTAEPNGPNDQPEHRTDDRTGNLNDQPEHRTTEPNGRTNDRTVEPYDRTDDPLSGRRPDAAVHQSASPSYDNMLIYLGLYSSIIKWTDGQNRPGNP